MPVATRSEELGWGLASTDEPMRPGTTMESLAALKTPFRAHGKVTAGNAAGINDGATAALLADEETARELGLPVRMRLVSYAFAGVDAGTWVDPNGISRYVHVRLASAARQNASDLGQLPVMLSATPSAPFRTWSAPAGSASPPATSSSPRATS